jgi:hypothetical protein
LENRALVAEKDKRAGTKLKEFCLEIRVSGAEGCPICGIIQNRPSLVTQIFLFFKKAAEPRETGPHVYLHGCQPRNFKISDILHSGTKFYRIPDKWRAHPKNSFQIRSLRFVHRQFNLRERISYLLSMLMMFPNDFPNL